ncbi:hypothetical protein ACHAPE_003068 [Trichoderma viride]
MISKFQPYIFALTPPKTAWNHAIYAQRRFGAPPLGIGGGQRHHPGREMEIVTHDQNFRTNNAATFAVESGFDYHGGDYKTVTANSLHDCIKVCSTQAARRAVPYAATGKSCWLKATVFTPSPTANSFLADGHEFVVKQNIPLCPGYQYELTFDLPKLETVNGDAAWKAVAAGQQLGSSPPGFAVPDSGTGVGPLYLKALSSEPKRSGTPGGADENSINVYQDIEQGSVEKTKTRSLYLPKVIEMDLPGSQVVPLLTGITAVVFAWLWLSARNKNSRTPLNETRRSLAFRISNIPQEVMDKDKFQNILTKLPVTPGGTVSKPKWTLLGFSYSPSAAPSHAER